MITRTTEHWGLGFGVEAKDLTNRGHNVWSTTNMEGERVDRCWGTTEYWGLRKLADTWTEEGENGAALHETLDSLADIYGDDERVEITDVIAAWKRFASAVRPMGIYIEVGEWDDGQTDESGI